MGNLYTSTTFMEHNSHPGYKYEMDAPTHEHDGINPSCGDELTLQLRVENNVIEEASFTGHGCAISQALRGRPGRPGRGRPAPGHLAHARPRQMRRVSLAYPRRHARRVN